VPVVLNFTGKSSWGLPVTYPVFTFAPLFGLLDRHCPPPAALSLVRSQVWLARAVLVEKCSASNTTCPPLSKNAPNEQLPLSGCVQLPALHTSLVHELPSSAQGLVLFVCWQPTEELHASFVQALPSSQLTVLCWQPSVGSQLSAVQALLSLQSRGVPLWQPRVRSQTSVPLHAWLSLQAALFG
jgi:hypothetical protein